MSKRWYDSETTLSLAISMLKNATPDMQDSVCEFVTKLFEKKDIKPSDKFIVFKMFDKRWYDEKENLYVVLETLRCCTDSERREIALSIINHLCNIVK